MVWDGGETWVFAGGQVLHGVHHRSDCDGRACVMHNPSDHPLKDATLLWRDDRGLMERICDHGVGHPDPDDLAYKKLSGADDGYGVHGCDGCCGERRFGDQH